MKSIEAKQRAQGAEHVILNLFPVFHQQIRGPVESHVRHAVEINLEQLAQRTLCLQPIPGGQLRGRLCDAPDQIAQNASAHDAINTQFAQFVDQTQFCHRMQGHVLNADRARLREGQGIDLDLLNLRSALGND